MIITSTFRKAIMTLFGSCFFYLVYACIAQRLTVWGITGNILWAYLAIMIVSCGKKSAFCCSAIIGLLLESMLEAVSGFSLICYVVICFLFSLVFADRPWRIRTRKGILFWKDRQGDLPPFMRVLLCAFSTDLVYHIARIAFVTLSGVPLTFAHFARMFAALVYTVLWAALLYWPVRKLLGMYRRPSYATGGENA